MAVTPIAAEERVLHNIEDRREAIRTRSGAVPDHDIGTFAVQGDWPLHELFTGLVQV